MMRRRWHVFIETPSGGSIAHPVETRQQVCDVIERMEPHVPDGSWWSMKVIP